MSKAKISDVRQGVTLYYVHAFPHKEISGHITQIFVTERPYHNGTGIFSSGMFKCHDSTETYICPFSLRDAGIIPNKSNFHKTFTSRKSAERYLARMNRVCLTAAERVKYMRKILDW